jgi:CMP/dCMP kinase
VSAPVARFGSEHHAPVVTLDGPSGSGKGTVASALASRLGWHLLDSGALYRLLALVAERQGLAGAQPTEIRALALRLNVQFEPANPIRVVWGGEDVSTELRTEACGRLASRLAVMPEVRAALLQAQRTMRRPPGLVADGRDMGTVVFPDARVKVYLTAATDERARRRYKQLKQLGMDANLEAISQDMVERDTRDSQRSVAPLFPALDARVVDTTGMPVEAVVERVVAFVHQALDRTG